MADWISSAPEPKTALGRHRLLAPNAGIRVSPLQLGAMSVGDAWAGQMGSMVRNLASQASFESSFGQVRHGS